MGIQTVNGKKVFIVPSTVKVKRGWFTRFFSLPWRPLQGAERIPNPSRMRDGEIVKTGDVYFMNESTARELEKDKTS